ncbi:DNA-binding protein [Methylobacterium sp. P1-11]|nr:DNA-binding protein [Methylobacterium sp. P1-11]
MNTRCKPPVPVGNPLLVGARELGAFLGLSPRSVYFLVAKGRIAPVFRLGGRRMYAERNALQAWLADQMRSGQAVSDASADPVAKAN